MLIIQSFDDPTTDSDESVEDLRNSLNMKDDEGGKKKSLDGALAGSGDSTREALLGLAGGVLFGLVSPVVGHPFDTVKTRMQAHSTGLVPTMRTIYSSQGLLGFYRGFIPPLMGSVVFRSIQFSAYAGAFAACEHTALHEPIPYTGGLRPSVLVGGTAAALARALVESPLDFIKVRLMVGKTILQPQKHAQFWKSPLATTSNLYHGFSATFLRTWGLLGTFFVLADYSVRWIPDVINAPVTGPFFKGGICATAAWTIAFPMETAKSVLQANHHSDQKPSTLRVLGDLYRERGIRGWYRGFGPGASRSLIANGVSMSVYTWFQNTMRKDD